MAAKGYPGTYDKGSEIRGLDAARADPGVEIFHAGTSATATRIARRWRPRARRHGAGRHRRRGQARAYAAVDKIDWPEGFCRHDIGSRAT